jgi:hypothetical protein
MQFAQVHGGTGGWACGWEWDGNGNGMGMGMGWERRRLGSGEAQDIIEMLAGELYAKTNIHDIPVARCTLTEV